MLTNGFIIKYPVSALWNNDVKSWRSVPHKAVGGLPRVGDILILGQVEDPNRPPPTVDEEGHPTLKGFFKVVGVVLIVRVHSGYMSVKPEAQVYVHPTKDPDEMFLEGL